MPGRGGVSSVFWGRSPQLPLALPAATLAPTGARLTGFHMICRCPFLLVGGEQSSSIRFGRIRRAPSGSEDESHARRFSASCAIAGGGEGLLF